jgi:hypothetical protein
VVPDEYKQYLGEQPRELSIFIPVEDDELWCSQYYKCYSRTRGLTCRGDGMTCKRMLDKDTGAKANRDTKEVVWKIGLECKGRECPDYLAKECKETMNLQFIMPDLPGLGVIQIDTSSINSIRNINSDATMIRAVYKRIAMLPLLLTLEPQEVVNPDDGKKKTVRCMHLRITGSLRDLMLEAAKPVTELLLPAPAEDEAPLDTDTNGKDFQPEEMPKVTTSPAEAQEIKEAGLFADGDCTPPTPKPAANVIRKIEPGQANALIVLSGATDEADLRVKAEAKFGRPMKFLTEVTFKEAADWINELQPVKKGARK